MSKLNLIKVYKDNCDPCFQMSEFLNDNNIKVESYNVMKNTDIAVRYGIMSVPVLLLVNENGDEITRSFGFKPVEIMRLAEQIEESN